MYLCAGCAQLSIYCFKKQTLWRRKYFSVHGWENSLTVCRSTVFEKPLSLYLSLALCADFKGQTVLPDNWPWVKPVRKGTRVHALPPTLPQAADALTQTRLHFSGQHRDIAVLRFLEPWCSDWDPASMQEPEGGEGREGRAGEGTQTHLASVGKKKPWTQLPYHVRKVCTIQEGKVGFVCFKDARDLWYLRRK